MVVRSRLSPKQRRDLRARAHALRPVILVGEAGISEGLVAETDRALEAHELIKVRLPQVDRDARDALAAKLCRAVSADEVQAIGRIRVLFRPRAPAPQPSPAERNRAPAGATRTGPGTAARNASRRTAGRARRPQR